MLYTLERAEQLGWGDEALPFATFMNACNAKVQEETGLSIDDYPDWEWAEAFSSGNSVEEVVDEFFEFLFEEGM